MANTRQTKIIISAELRADQLDQQIGKVKTKLNSMQASLAKASGQSLAAVEKAVATNTEKSLKVIERYQDRLANAQKKISTGAAARRTTLEAKQSADLAKLELSHLAKYQKTNADVTRAQAKAEADKVKYLAQQAYYVKSIKASNRTPEDKVSAISKTKAYYGGLVNKSFADVAAVKLQNSDGRDQQAELTKARNALFSRQRGEMNALRKAEETAQASLQKYVTQRKNEFTSTFAGAVATRGQVFSMSDAASARRKDIADRKNEQENRMREAAAARRAQQQQRLQQERDKEFSRVRTGATATGGMLAAGLAGFTASVALQKTAEYDQLKARVVNVSASLKEADMNMAALRRTSEITGQSMAGTVAMFARIAPAMKANNLSNQDTLDFVNAFQNSLRASGTSMEQASAAAYQLSQALSTGVLRGDELNSVMEGAPAFAMALANSIGKTMGGMKELGEQGQLTTEVISNAAKQSGPLLERMAKNVPLTPQQQLTQVVDRLVEAFSKLDKEYGILEKIGNMLKFVGDNASAVVSTIKVLVTALATLYATNKIMGLVGAFSAAKTKLLSDAKAIQQAERTRTLGTALTPRERQLDAQRRKREYAVAMVDAQIPRQTSKGKEAWAGGTGVVPSSKTLVVPASVSSTTAVAAASKATARAGKGKTAPAAAPKEAGEIGVVGSLLSVFGLKILAATLVFEGLLVAGAALSAWFSSAPKWVRNSQLALSKAEQAQTDAFDSGDIYKKNIADQNLDTERRNRQAVLELRNRRLASNFFQSDDSISEQGTNQAEINLLIMQRRSYAKQLAEQQKEMDSGTKTLKLGDVLSMRGALKLDDKRGFGGVNIGKDVFAQLKQFDNLTKIMNGSAVLGAGVSATVSLSDLSQGLSTLFATIKTSSDISASISTLNKSLESLGNNKDAFLLVGDAVRSLTDKLSDAIEKELNEKVEFTTRRLTKLEKAASAVYSNQSRSLIFESNLRTTDDEVAAYGRGNDTTGIQARNIAETIQAQRDEEQQMLKLRLANVDTEKAAKLQALDQSSKLDLRNIAESEKRSIEAVRKYVAGSEKYVKDNKLEGQVDNARKQVGGLLYDSEKLNSRVFVGTGNRTQLADLDQIEKARESVRANTEKTITDLERAANQERLSILVEYQKGLESSISEMLRSYEQYTKKVIDLDREMATKKLTNEKMVRDQRVTNANTEAKIAFMQRQATGEKGLGKFNDAAVPIVAAQDVLKKAQEKLSTAPTEYDQRKAIEEVKEASKELLDLQLHGLGNAEKDARGNTSVANLQRTIQVRQEYMRVLEETNAKELELDKAQRNSIQQAAENVGRDVNDAIAERDDVQAQTSQYSAAEMAKAQGEVNALNLRPSEESLASLRNTIQTALDSQPFTIRFDAADANAAKSNSSASAASQSSLTPVNMIFNGAKAPTVYTDSNNLNSLNAVVKTAVR